VVSISGPIQFVVVWAVDGVTSLWHHYIGLVDTQAANDRLMAENAHLKAELVSREEQRLENERLRQLVGLKERAPDVSTVYARVIATSPTPLFRSVRVDRGASDHVRLGAAVISDDGVVGRVAALTDSYADVMLLVDANSSTDVLVQRTRARARVRGTGSDKHLGIQVEYLARAADVEPGDVLITSGAGSVFPKGLVVGAVMSVERGAFGLYQRAMVEPRVEFSRIEGVIIIIDGVTHDTTFEERRAAPEILTPLVDGGSDAENLSALLPSVEALAAPMSGGPSRPAAAASSVQPRAAPLVPKRGGTPVQPNGLAPAPTGAPQ
jgi:rod shape-determining protein MreC